LHKTVKQCNIPRTLAINLDRLAGLAGIADRRVGVLRKTVKITVKIIKNVVKPLGFSCGI